MTPLPFLALPASAAAVLTTLAFVLAASCQAGLLLYAAHRWTLLGRLRRLPPPPPPADWPRVTMQLPVYEEPNVVERLVDAACALEYPADRLEVQVLDDSSDEGAAPAAAVVARWQARGIDVRHLRRGAREGYKAGALAAGLAQASGEFVAVFDADFVPPADFLRRMLPHFSDPGVGMVQACWGHLNRERSALTAAQAVMLDAHFLVEHASRMSRGLFLNFNGTAGVWRRACIDDAGGWAHDTLTEDLDLSYRAQLRGWRFVFEPGVVVPAELPAGMDAFLSQQHRWAKGALQTARKLLPVLWRSRLPLAVKAEGTIHLTANLAYPLLLALGLLTPVALLARPQAPPALAWGLHGVVFALGLLPVALFIGRGQLAAGVPARRVPVRVLAALVLAAGASLHNARAVAAGLMRRGGEFVRTPKTGDTDRRPAGPAAAGPRARRGEAVLGLLFAALLAWDLAAGPVRALPLLALLAAGFAWVGTSGRLWPSSTRD